MAALVETTRGDVPAGQTPPSVGQFDLRPIEQPDLEEVTRLLVRVLLDDPVYQWVFPGREERWAMLPAFISSSLRLHRRFGHMMGVCPSSRPGADPIGVAMWYSPERPWPPPWWGFFPEAFRVLPLQLSLGVGAYRRFCRVNGVLKALRRERSTGTRFWYLAGLAVAPEFRRQGAATALVRAGIARADGVPVCAETAGERARDLFHGLGFKLRHTRVVKHSPLTFWSMVHDPEHRMR
jgi:ribosomal protein S18 acetylase RimI-like enzyme